MSKQDKIAEVMEDNFTDLAKLMSVDVMSFMSHECSYSEVLEAYKTSVRFAVMIENYGADSMSDMFIEQGKGEEWLSLLSQLGVYLEVLSKSLDMRKENLS